ncbi:MAG TPA: biopolymer transporter ExbD [Bacteroidota bacterium]|nr:biopolymer transporter ExbD [Bacteroidota bacterium]
MKFQRERKYLVAFSYASLTDVVLQLLIFFLLSSTFVMQSGIKVQLPKAVYQEQESKSEIRITLASNGQIFLNNQQILKSSLRPELVQLIKDSQNTLIVLEADQNVTIQQTVDIMDVAKAAGATRFLIATQPSEGRND